MAGITVNYSIKIIIFINFLKCIVLLYLAFGQDTMAYAMQAAKSDNVDVVRADGHLERVNCIGWTLSFPVLLSKIKSPTV